MANDDSRRSAWALCDQGLVSAGNFLTNVILIRHLPADQFGVFALLLNALLFLNNIHASMVTYCILIEGARADGKELRRVASGGVVATLTLSLVSVLVVSFATSYVAHRELLVVVLMASVSWQVQEALRTIFASHLRYEKAIGGDALSYIGQAAVIAFVVYRGSVSLNTVFWAMIGTSLVAAIVQGIQIQPATVTWSWLVNFGKRVWKLGKWSALAKLVAFFSLQAFPWVLAYRHGIVTVATFQSLFQLLALTNPVLLSANNLIMASVAKSVHQGRPALYNAKQFMLYSGAIVGAYFTVLLLGGRQVMKLFYGEHSPYLSSSALLPVFVIAYALEFVAMFAGAVLAGKERTRFLFIQQLAGMVVAIVIVLPWTAYSGISAAIAGLLLVNTSKAATGWYLVSISSDNPRQQGATKGASEYRDSSIEAFTDVF